MHQSLGPARLLGFETVHVHREFGSTFDLREVEKPPAFELRAIREIGVFSECVVLPAAGIIDGFAAPDPGGPVEIEKSAPARTRTMLNDEMAVEKNGLNVSEQGVVAVEIGPARLHHADLTAALRIHEVGNGAEQKIRFGEKVGVEDGDEFALGGFQPVFQSAGFVAFAVAAMEVNDSHALCGVALHTGSSDFAGLIGGVVQHLHVEQLGWVVEARHSFDETLNDVALVEDGQLNGDARPIGHRRRSRGEVLGIGEIVVHQPIAVQAVDRKDEKDDEIRNHHREVEGIGVVHAGKGLIGNLVPIVADRVLCRKSCRK